MGTPKNTMTALSSLKITGVLLGLLAALASASFNVGMTNTQFDSLSSNHGGSYIVDTSGNAYRVTKIQNSAGACPGGPNGDCPNRHGPTMGNAGKTFGCNDEGRCDFCKQKWKYEADDYAILTKVGTYKRRGEILHK